MFRTKVLIEPGNLINFTSPILETGGHFTWSSEPREGLAVSRAKAILSLSDFKTLSIGPAYRIDLAASRSAVKCSTELANGLPRHRNRYCVRSAGLQCALRGTQGMRYWRKKKRNSMLPNIYDKYCWIGILYMW